MAIILILTIIVCIYIYALIGSFAVGLCNMELYEVFVFLLWPVFLIGYVLYTTCEYIGKYIFKPMDGAEKLGRVINTYFENKKKKGE